MRRLFSRSIAARLSAFVLALLAALSFPVLGVSPMADAPRLQPNALLTIDQNRATVVDRILREWGESLTWSNAGINNVQLREMLMGLRADHLLAASLAGNLDGLRNVLANALTSTAQVAPSLLQTKALGDIGDDLVYTPVTPCRVVDSRLAGGVLAAGSTRNWLAANPGGNFTAQGGSSMDCGIPVKPPAVLVNVTVANTGGGPAFLTAWPYNQAQPLASTLNWTAANSIVANAVIVPLCTGACADDFSVYVSSATDVIVDVAGYFARPKNYGGTHVITGQYATDSGGYNNTASGFRSTVAGGDTNTASGGWGTVAGGGANIASGISSTVAGGGSNTASGDFSSVGGGQYNTASGNYSTVGGGYLNTASGYKSTVAGGALNTASGDYSFAAGYRAKAANAGVFAIADTENVEFLIGVTNFFGARFNGGFMFATSVDGGGHYLTGCQLPGGSGTFSCASSRETKTGFRRIDPRAVYRAVAALPIQSWRYKGEQETVRHIGPMAEDFRAAFQYGFDTKSIAVVDAQGVALAAIQGLHQVMQQKDTKLQQQSREISMLKRKLQAIEAKLGLN